MQEHVVSSDRRSAWRTARNFAYRIGDQVGNLVLSPPSTAFGYYVNHGPRHERLVALTFDDGPCRGSTEALATRLAELDVRATFFCVGENVRANPGLLRRLHDDGHDIGSHSERHSRSAGLSARDTDHIESAERAIADVLGVRPRLYRPPWGWLTPWEGRRLHQRGYTIVGWDVYTLDWQIPEPDARAVAEAAVADTRAGSIICLHDGFPLEPHWDKQVTVDAVSEIVPRLRADGYRFVPVSELLRVHPYAADPPVPAVA